MRKCKRCDKPTMRRMICVTCYQLWRKVCAAARDSNVSPPNFFHWIEGRR